MLHASLRRVSWEDVYHLHVICIFRARRYCSTTLVRTGDNYHTIHRWFVHLGTRLFCFLFKISFVRDTAMQSRFSCTFLLLIFDISLPFSFKSNSCVNFVADQASHGCAVLRTIFRHFVPAAQMPAPPFLAACASVRCTRATATAQFTHSCAFLRRRRCYRRTWPPRRCAAIGGRLGILMPGAAGPSSPAVRIGATSVHQVPRYGTSGLGFRWNTVHGICAL